MTDVDDSAGDPACWAERVCGSCGRFIEGDHVCAPFDPFVARAITGWEQDEAGEWVATLACAHRQHVRHQPPLRPRPWVLTEPGRASRVGAELECRLCGRGELPTGLRVARSLGPFDDASLPADLPVPERSWSRLRLHTGSMTVVLRTNPPHARPLRAGDELGLPPGVEHRIHGSGVCCLTVDVLER